MYRKPRAGATLIEVLMASFIMAIGMIALLALFPLGAVSMAQAIRDNRVTACVENATATATTKNLRHEPLVSAAFTNPGAQFQDAPLDGPSHPVYVDPVGVSNYLAPYSGWVAGLSTDGIPRRSVSFVTGAQATQKTLSWFTLLDDINFDKKAQAGVNGNPTERNVAYSWAYLMRRPKQGVSSVVEMWVVVYSQRSLQLNASTLGGDETPYNATFTPAYNPAARPTVVTLAGTPALRVGGWILDCTKGAPGANGKLTPGNARFYRVVAITENAGSVDVEVDTPILNYPNIPNRFAVLEGVAEVVDKGTTWLP
jgi:hypothetical protein